MSKMELRPYQRTCINAVNQYLRDNAGHPVVSIPTAGGKTIIFGTMIREWLETWPGSRVCILAHRQELLTQAEEKIKIIWPEAPISVYSAGLKRRELTEDILIAGIQSIYKRADEVQPFDIIIVDEVHLVPNSSETMYRAFIDDLMDQNPALRVIGWTATPYRLDGGELAGPEEEKLFDHVCYEANINQLIEDKYICQLSTKATDVRLDTAGIHTRQGDFVQGEMDRRFSNRGIVEKAVEEIIQKADSRKSWLVFCCGVDHARAVLHEIRSYGVDAELVIGKTDKEDRGDILQRFDSGDLRCIVNVNCLTTGLDVTRIDMIAMLRPTQSTSLWVQAVGRGFRLHPGKKDALILDFGENCLRHGPINNIKIQKKGGGGDGSAPVKTCPDCKEYVMAGVKECPECGHQFPEREVSHLSRSSEAEILARQIDTPVMVNVDYVSVRRHTKAGKPDSIRVSYHCGLNVYSEWICFSHGGYAAEKARYWWLRRFSSADRPAVPEATEEALYTLLRMNNGLSPINSHGSPNYHHDLSSMTHSIKIQRQGKYTQVMQVHLDSENRAVRNV